MVGGSPLIQLQSVTLFNEPTTIQMLPPLAYSPKAIRLRFEVTDTDGLHQAQLIIPTTAEDPARGPKLHGCKRLNGESNTIEFITTELTVEPATEVSLHVIDVHGSITRRAYAFTKADVLPDPNDRTPTILEKISGDNQDGLSVTPLLTHLSLKSPIRMVLRLKKLLSRLPLPQVVERSIPHVPRPMKTVVQRVRSHWGPIWEQTPSRCLPLELSKR